MRPYRGGTCAVALCRRDALLLKELQAEILQLELLDFAAAGHREGIDDEDILRDLVACDLATAEVLDLILGEVGTLVADNEGANLLAVFFDGTAATCTSFTPCR